MTEKHHTSPNLNHSDENPTDRNSVNFTPKFKTSHPCSTCNKAFMSPVHLMQHIAAKHPITDIAADSNRAAARYGCHACKKTFQSPVDLAQHTQIKHSQDPAEESTPMNNECNLGLDGLETLSQHGVLPNSNQNHPSFEQISTNFFSKLCEDVQYTRKLNDSTPLSTATDYECPSCEMTFTTVLSLAEHMRTKHQTNNPKPAEEKHPTDTFTPDINTNISSTATITEHTEKVHGGEAILNNSAPPSHWSSTATITKHTEKDHGAEAILNNSAPPSHWSSTATITEHTENVHGAEAILNNSAPPSHWSSTATITEHTENVHGAEAILNNSAPPSHCSSTATITEHTEKVHGAEAILNNSAPPSHWSSTATITKHTEKVHGAEAILNNSAGSHHLGGHQRTVFEQARSSGASVAEQVENEYLWDSAISDSVLTEDLPVYQCSLCPLAFLRQTQLMQHSKENHCTDNCKPDANNIDTNHLKGHHLAVKCRPDVNKSNEDHLMRNHHTDKCRPDVNKSNVDHLMENHHTVKYRPCANNSDTNHLQQNHLRAKCRPDVNKSNVDHLKKNHCTVKCRPDASNSDTNHLKGNHRTDKPRSDANNNDTHHLKIRHAADRTEHTKKKSHRETSLKYQCPLCPEAFTLRVHIMQHERDKHSQDNHQVTGLKGISTATAHNGDERLREKSGADSTREVKTTNSHLCPKCSKTFKSVIDLMQHQRAKHHIRGIAALTSLESLSLHMTEKHHASPNLNHSDEIPTDKNSGDLTPKFKTSHPCSTCNKSFMSPVHLMQHIAAKHPITDIAADSNRAAARYGCHACKKTFKSPVFLAQHIQMKRSKHKTKELPPTKKKRQNSQCMRLPVAGHVRCCLCGKTRLAGQEWEDHCRRRHPDWKCCQCGEAYRNQISLDGHKNLKCACGTRSCKVLAPEHAKICKLSAKFAEHVQGKKRPREEDDQGPTARKRRILLNYRDYSCD